MAKVDADLLKERIYTKVSELSGVPRGDIGPETTLESVGLESPDAVILALEVEEITGEEIDVGIFLRFTTLGEAVDHVADGAAALP